MTITLIPLMHQWHAAHLQKAPFRCISDNNNSSLFSSNYWQITMMTNILIPLVRQWYAAHLQKTPFRCISDNSNSNFFSSTYWQITTMTNILIPLMRQWYAAHLQKTPLRCISDKKRIDYAFRRQFNEKPRIIPGCPDASVITITVICFHQTIDNAYLEKAPFGCISGSLIPRQIPDSRAVTPLLAPHHPYSVRHGLQHHNNNN